MCQITFLDVNLELSIYLNFIQTNLFLDLFVCLYRVVIGTHNMVNI